LTLGQINWICTTIRKYLCGTWWSFWLIHSVFGCQDTRQTNILKATTLSSTSTPLLTLTPFLGNTSILMTSIFRPDLSFGCVLMEQSPPMHGSSTACGTFSPVPSLVNQCGQEVLRHLQNQVLPQTLYKLQAGGHRRPSIAMFRKTPSYSKHCWFASLHFASLQVNTCSKFPFLYFWTISFMPTRALTIRLLFSFSEIFSFFISALAIGQILTIITFILLIQFPSTFISPT
jgi:hypothetical protein